uniref:Uncharacterized protein n=1 Tax=Chlorocebus sabaeus TaxID=60711 RepID=A0A0D9RNJ4_CHLSB
MPVIPALWEAKMGPVSEEDKRERRSLVGNPRDCSSCERSRACISCHTHTIDGEKIKLHFLRMALGALQLVPVHLQPCQMPPGESCHPKQERAQLPGAWRQRTEEPAPDIRMELKGWLGVTLPWTGSLGKSTLMNPEEQFVISPSNIQRHLAGISLLDSVPRSG